MHELITDPRTHELIARALEEDMGRGDISSKVAVNPEGKAEAVIEARMDLVVSGLPVAAAVFGAVDASIAVELVANDGDSVCAMDAVLRCRGPARGILSAERTALNFVQRMSGIATHAAAFVSRVKDTGVVILDTRKTTPLHRFLEKYAVRSGGGENHRMGLYDRLMFKDNHLVEWKKRHCGGLGDLVLSARKAYPDLPLEVEVESVDAFRSVIGDEPDWILLDNMALEEMRECVTLRRGGTRLEASGGVTLERVRDIAETGIDAISIGGLTHASPWADLALEIV